MEIFEALAQAEYVALERAFGWDAIPQSFRDACKYS